MYRIYNCPNKVVVTDSADEIARAAAEHIAAIGFEHDGIRLKADFIVTSEDALEEDYIKEVHDLYYRIPRVILETERTVIKQMDPENDMTELFHLYEKPGITEFIEPLYPYLEEKAYERDYFDNIYRFYDFGMWNVFLKSDERLIGRCGLEYKALPDSASDRSERAVTSNDREAECGDNNVWLELGYVIDPDLWHQGFGYETTKAVLNLARSKGHHQIFAVIAPENSASVALAKKLGFKAAGKASAAVRQSLLFTVSE